jgi:hypothetical protein
MVTINTRLLNPVIRPLIIHMVEPLRMEPLRTAPHLTVIILRNKHLEGTTANLIRAIILLRSILRHKLPTPHLSTPSRHQYKRLRAWRLTHLSHPIEIGSLRFPSRNKSTSGLYFSQMGLTTLAELKLLGS